MIMTKLWTALALSGIFLTANVYAQPTAKPTSAAKTEDTANQVSLENNAQSNLVEIANLQVFSEICPRLIGNNRYLKQGISRMYAKYLPDLKDPELAVKALNQEDYYQPFLKDARQEVAKATREDNRQVCISIVDWAKKNNS